MTFRFHAESAASVQDNERVPFAFGTDAHARPELDARWPEAKAFCQDVADAVASAAPKTYARNMSKAARPGKIFLDYLRNGRGAMAMVAYSTRARSGAPVSTQLTWKELSPKIPSLRSLEGIGQGKAILTQPWKMMGQ